MPTECVDVVIGLQGESKARNEQFEETSFYTSLNSSAKVIHHPLPMARSNDLIATISKLKGGVVDTCHLPIARASMPVI